MGILTLNLLSQFEEGAITQKAVILALFFSGIFSDTAKNSGNFSATAKNFGNFSAFFSGIFSDTAKNSGIFSATAKNSGNFFVIKKKKKKSLMILRKSTKSTKFLWSAFFFLLSAVWILGRNPGTPPTDASLAYVPDSCPQSNVWRLEAANSSVVPGIMRVVICVFIFIHKIYEKK